jgi:hypothetical protein
LYYLTLADRARMVPVEDRGTRPTPCYGGSLSKISETTLFLCGGRNDYQPALVLRECFIFYLALSEWEKVIVNGDYEPVYYHGAEVVNQAVMIFGGLEESSMARHGFKKIQIM